MVVCVWQKSYYYFPGTTLGVLGPGFQLNNLGFQIPLFRYALEKLFFWFFIFFGSYRGPKFSIMNFLTIQTQSSSKSTTKTLQRYFTLPILKFEWTALFVLIPSLMSLTMHYIYLFVNSVVCCSIHSS